MKTNRDVWEYVDGYMKTHGLRPAFPIGISINHVIAHDSYHEGAGVLGLNLGDFVKVDVGFVSDGNIIDGARTFIYGESSCTDQGSNSNPDVDRWGQPVADCMWVAKEVERAIKDDVDKYGCVRIQKISALTYSLMVSKGYEVLDYLGGHTIEYGKVHGKHLILNKPRKLLDCQAQQFIDPDAVVSEGDMFAIEIYMGDRKGAKGTMVKSCRLPVTHYEVNEDYKDSAKCGLSPEECRVLEQLAAETNGLVYSHTIHAKYPRDVVEKLINTNRVLCHEPLEFIPADFSGVKYVQYEDCFIISGGKLWNLTG